MITAAVTLVVLLLTLTEALTGRVPKDVWFVAGVGVGMALVCWLL